MPKAKRNPLGGRPSYKPTDRDRTTVEVMCGGGIHREKIALALGIDEKTLRKHFRTELATGDAKMQALVMAALRRNIVGGNVTAQIWYTKARMGWSERIINENVGRNGGPMVSAVLDMNDPAAAAQAYQRLINGDNPAPASPAPEIESEDGNGEA